MIDLSAFGKNDIRGIYGENITEDLFYYTGRGFVKYLAKESGKQYSEIWVSVCMDARLHSPALSKALINGILSTGANVVNMGLAPTPLGYYSEAVGLPPYVTKYTSVTGAMIITASHNPSQYNGLKMTYDKQSLNEEQIKQVKACTEEEYQMQMPSSPKGIYTEYDLIPDYIEAMSEKFGRIGEGIKVVVDSANGTGGVVAPKLYRALGCEVIELYSMPDGRFPHHHPNPSDIRTLKDIKNAVVANGADIGIAFDGDSDRIGVIDSEGNYLTGDKLLLIYAQDTIKEYNKKDIKPFIVSEVKCSQVLYDTIDDLGGIAVMCKTGHGYIKSKMKEVGAVLAGEMSGHTFFKDRYYGFDDAVYAGCRIIEILSEKKYYNKNFKISDMLEPFNKVYSSDEYRLSCPNSLKKETLKEFEEIISKNPAFFGDKIKEIITLDGMRIVFECGGFALIRQSNTEPVFTLRFEAKDKNTAQKYEDLMVNKLMEIIKEKALVQG
ncbi:MAG: phosphomannomutase/phosphoglucomutase [bacterium]|nr:phosphomannomutase/phosphoglucomutase [bacterium]